MFTAPVSGGVINGSCATVAMETKETQDARTGRLSEVLISRGRNRFECSGLLELREDSNSVERSNTNGGVPSNLIDATVLPPSLMSRLSKMLPSSG
jgi:hypothetical protein